MIKLHYEGLAYEDPSCEGNMDYIVFTDFPTPVFLEDSTVFVLRGRLYVSKSFYNLPDFDGDQNSLEEYCKTTAGKVLVDDTVNFAKMFSTSPQARDLAKIQMALYF